MITTTITVPYDGENIHKLFAAEEQTLVNDRATYTVTEKENQAIITITASDATALRAVTNSVCKILIIYEKTKKAIEDDN